MVSADALARAQVKRQEAIWTNGPECWDASLTLEKAAEMIEHGNLCELCHVPGTPDDPLGWDRIIPGSQGGRYTLTPVPNVCPMHSGCNIFKADFTFAMTYEEADQVYANIVRLHPAGVPITPQSAADALTRGRLVDAATVPVVPHHLQPIPTIEPWMERAAHGTQPLAWKARHAYLAVRLGDHPERLDRASLQSFEQTLPLPCYLCGAHSGPGHWGCVDRVNPNLGYGPHNGLPCCNRCNQSKFNRTLVAHLATVLAVHAVPPQERAQD